MQNLRNIAVLIPAYNPDKSLPGLAGELSEKGFTIIVVNDGSDKSYSEVFEKTKGYATVVEHEINQGKGAALKTGIEYIKRNYAGLTGFITADADGQHSVKDILRVAERMTGTDGIVLGMRNLQQNIPFKSKFGNVLSKWVFGIITGRVLEDNQAGLRGFSIRLCDWLLSIEGKYYEYEMYMLVKAVRDRIEIVKLPIDTIYINNNSTTHFKPVKDTCRIQGSLIKNGKLSIILYALLFLIAVVSMLKGFAWYIFAAAACVLFFVHIALKRKELNFRRVIIILIKYILAVLCIAGSYLGIRTTVPGIIVCIVLIPVISYLSADRA